MQKRVIRPVGHHDELSLVEHLDELRTRLIISLVALVIAFGVCFWQNHALLELLTKPLTAETQQAVRNGKGTPGQTSLAQQAILKTAATEEQFAAAIANPSSGLPAATRAAAARTALQLRSDVSKIPRTPVGDKPLTLGIGEPFTVTVTVTLYFALLFSLPLLLFQLYGFVIPAFSPKERSVALPVLLGVPALFVGGLAFGYYVVLPAAVHFLQNFNSDQFNVQVQATSYYPFAALILLAMGAIFQVPVAVIAAARAGIVTTAQLRHNRRYAIVIAAVIAALLPGDVVTMLFETLPVIVLYEASILITSLLDRRDARRDRAQARASATTQPPPPPPPIDHDDAL